MVHADRKIIRGNCKKGFSDRDMSAVRPSICPHVMNFSHFQVLLQNHYIPSHQTYYKYSSRGSAEVLYLLEGIRNSGRHNVFDVTQTDNFQHQSQFVDNDNITV